MDQASTAEITRRPEADPVPSPPPAPDPTRPAVADKPESASSEQQHGRVETPETVATDAARQFRGLRFALGVAVAIAVTVILTAINVQSGRILDREGHGWSFRALFGPVFPGPDLFSSTNMQGWRVVSELGQLSYPDRYAYLLRLFTGADLAFIIVYFFLLRAVVTTIARGFWLRLGSWALLALVAADLIENALSWPGLLNPPPTVIVVATALKWLALLVVVSSVVLSAVTSPRQSDSERSVSSRLKRTWKAVLHQRFSFVPVVVLFILSVPSGAALLEQLPDALRRWVSDGGVGARQAVLSMLCTLGLGAFLIVAGRYRTGYAFRHPDPPPQRPPDQRPPYLWPWLVGPVVAVAGAVMALVTLRSEDILVLRLFAFLLLPVVVIIGSLLLRRRWEQHPDEIRDDDPPRFNERELTAVRLAGNIAGLGAIAVGGLSLLRAYVPLLLVPNPTPLGLVWLFLIVGGGAVIVPWLVAMALTWRAADRRTSELAAGRAHELRSNKKAEIPVGSWVLLISAVGVFVGLGIFPRLAAWIGLAGTATLALGSMAGMLSAIALLIQDRPTAEIFRVLRLRRSPLVSLLALSLVLVSLFGGQGSIHEVDRGVSSDSPADTRLTMEGSFNAWLDSRQPCAITVGGRQVRPMLLIAAEGGGIRAAYWTVRGLQAIADTTCGERSALFSAGASGGSVGLTVTRFSGTPAEPNVAGAVDAVKQMAAPGILSRAADGTFVRDLVYGATGVPVQRYGEPDPFTWKDRARLIEDGWADAPGAGALDWGDREFLTPADQLSPATGQLILNSSDVKHACRVWVSQVSPGLPVTEYGAASFDPELSCDKSPGPGSRTVDLFTAYGPLVAGADPEACVGRIRSATAALLTARFPYVTPSAVIGPCPVIDAKDGKSLPHWPRTQLVDGGYIENSGLATITDLSDDWLSLVRDHNAEVLAAQGSAEPLVVPIVVFLTNGDRRVVQPAIDTSPVSELAVPVLTYLRGGASLGGNDALLERARAAVEIGGFCPRSAADVCSELQNHFPSRVVVVDRLTQPEIGAPLGWVMSEASFTSLDVAMVQGQLGVECTRNIPRTSGPYGPVKADLEREPSCLTGYATLGDLVRYYNTSS